MNDKLPGDAWLSGPDVPQGRLGLQPRIVRVTIPSADRSGDGELRHLEFDDPPGDMTSSEYEEYLRDCAREAPGVVELFETLAPGLVGDLIGSHDVDPVRAVRAVAEFATRLYRDFHSG